jgi:RNA polymerase sigma factor (sigma-70 family)
MLIIGGRDMEAGAVSVRLHHGGPQGAKPKGEVIGDILASSQRAALLTSDENHLLPFRTCADYLCKMNGTELLATYRKTGSETAFAELLRRYTNLVYSVANRRLADQSLAEEVTQTVFIRLAKSPPNLKHEGEIASWLHRTTVHVAVDVWRSETRRRTREQQTVDMQTLSIEEAGTWQEITPHLDEALNQLVEEDRQAVLLRFFERKPMRDIGNTLGVSEDAAKMRVSRALNRLRTQLVLRGITCGVAALGLLIAERSIVAAPANLAAKLVSASHAAISAHTSSLLPIGTLKLAGAATIILAVAIFFVTQTRKPPEAGPVSAVAAQEPSIPEERPIRFQRPSFDKPTANVSVPAPEKIHMRFQVLASDTGHGLEGAEVRAAYFYAGGRGEGHNLLTDRNGETLIPEANEGGDPGMNVFVSIPGYVPVAIGFGKNAPSEYVLKVDPAALVAGVVVDEEGQPVSGVRPQASRNGDYKNGKPNTDFQTTKVETDAAGRFQYPYLPWSYDEARFALTGDGYAVTHAVVPMGKPESLNAILVIKRGFAVTGRVNDNQGIPVFSASVKEFHNYGHRKLATETDWNGEFLLLGISGEYDPTVEITVEAKGMTPQLHKIELLQATNVANFSLTNATPFRGRVMDQFGQPLTGVACRTDSDNQGRQPFRWFTHTDAEGRFEWDSAPAEPTLFWFELAGYEVIRDRLLTADGSDHEITLVRKTE